MNVEHLLDAFTTIDTNSAGVWMACFDFMCHLYWHKKRPTILKPKIEGLPDDHPSKPRCLHQLSQLFESVGNRVECKRLLTHTLMLWRERGDNHHVAETLCDLSRSNRMMGLYGEGIQQSKEALKVYESLNHWVGMVECLINLAMLFQKDDELDAAEETASRVIGLLSEEGDRFKLCQCHRVLGDVYRSKGEIEKAIHHVEASLRIASSSNWPDELFWAHYSLAVLFCIQHGFNDTNAHIERVKSYADNNEYHLGCAIELQARIWYWQDRFEEARSEALRAADVYEKLGAVKELEECRELILQCIEEGMDDLVSSGQSESNDGELLQIVRFPLHIDFPF